MKFWQNISWAEAEQLTEIAKFAEEVGFYGVINSEHVFLTSKTQSRYPYTEDGKMNHALDYPYPDVWSSFGAMAAVTTRLRFTSADYHLPLRSPFEVAKATGTLALISNNRITIGFARGWLKEEFDAMDVDFHARDERIDEMIEVMRKLWKGGMVSHHGRFFNCEEIVMLPVPTEPVPFYCSGKNPDALRRAATLCDGYIATGHKVDDVPAVLAEVKRLRREAGRDHLPFEIIVAINPFLPLPDVNTFKRLEELGMTGTFNSPFDVVVLIEGAPRVWAGRLPSKRKSESWRKYARNVIEKMG